MDRQSIQREIQDNSEVMSKLIKLWQQCRERDIRLHNELASLPATIEPARDLVGEQAKLPVMKQDYGNGDWH